MILKKLPETNRFYKWAFRKVADKDSSCVRCEEDGVSLTVGECIRCYFAENGLNKSSKDAKEAGVSTGIPM